MSDTYAHVSIKEQKFKTEIVRKSYDPVWNSVFVL